MNLLLRPAKPRDIDALVRIEAQSFAEPNWRAEDFSKYETVVAEADGEIAGFLVSRELFPGYGGEPAEREILNIAVSASWRRKGIATRLLRRELKLGGVFFLEVRESNLAAQALYRKFGFVPIAKRPHYYEQPPETAIVMQLK